MQPVCASSAYTVPSLLPVITRPSTMLGCPKAVVPLGKPKAHLRFSEETWAASSPAAPAGWKRVLRSSGLQPFHEDFEAAGFAAAAQNPLISGTTDGPDLPR